MRGARAGGVMTERRARSRGHAQPRGIRVETRQRGRSVTPAALRVYASLSSPVAGRQSPSRVGGWENRPLPPSHPKAPNGAPDGAPGEAWGGCWRWPPLHGSATPACWRVGGTRSRLRQPERQTSGRETAQRRMLHNGVGQSHPCFRGQQQPCDSRLSAREWRPQARNPAVTVARSHPCHHSARPCHIPTLQAAVLLKRRGDRRGTSPAGGVWGARRAQELAAGQRTQHSKGWRGGSKAGCAQRVG